ncbi:ABC-type branched-chain amino acid transport system, periplasmic component [Beggiatoa alba B18LD]|uniref:ABC-type branched-chain amino acid transport system, periplasmic component n=1 Tax=Beggiatoa alba B18LD TaxID=395493 RepID=I3CD47_9GAMM|nr:ABC transporter substrate-binding protein [Beggiatoa alba]EIJ41540.1 ABC-type branched-chain amino acid transport system, periplasmic component [Beggiatoa alba B18LD]
MQLNLINKKIMPYLLLISNIIYLASCQSADNSIPIGFIAELTGLHSDLGVEIRDGALLAVEQTNAAGGINGRPIRLLMRDDQGNSDKARTACADLATQQVVSIFGTATSTTTTALLTCTTAHHIIQVSPTASSYYLAYQKDNLIRLMSNSHDEGIAMARYAYQKMGGRNVIAIIDLHNHLYTKAVWEAIQTTFRELGGNTQEPIFFTSGQTDLIKLISSNISLNTLAQADTVFLLSSAIDTALLLQYINQQKIQANFFASGWVDTGDLLKKGGRSTENLKLSLYYNPHDNSPAFLKFNNEFYTRFQRSSSFGSIYAYEAMLVLIEGLRRTGGQANGLQTALLNIKDFPLLQDNISIDKYGDVIRHLYIANIHDGKLEILDKVMAHP